MPSTPCFLTAHSPSSFLYKRPNVSSTTSSPSADSLRCSAAPDHTYSRRAALALFAATVSTAALAPAGAAQIVELYDANKSRRYIDQGRPLPDRPAPVFESGKSLFTIANDLQAQDIRVGSSDAASVVRGSLVVARWTLILEDGTIIEDSSSTPSMFRAGSHQVLPGIDDTVIGMKPGGMRRVRGPSERIFRYIASFILDTVYNASPICQRPELSAVSDNPVFLSFPILRTVVTLLMGSGPWSQPDPMPS